MRLDLVSDFLTWIDDLLRIRSTFRLDYFRFRTSLSYRYNLVFSLQLLLSEFEFQLLVLHADFCCLCSGNYICAYCLLDQVTQPMAVAAYLRFELLDLDHLNSLR